MPCSSVCPEAIGPDGFCDLHRPPETAWWPRGPMPARERCAGEALGRFIRWIRYGGAAFDALEVAAGPGGERHVRMRRPVVAGEPILAVPRRLVLTDDHVQAAPVGQALEEAGVTLQSPHSPLAAFLLAERMSPVAPWGPYVDVLPLTYVHLPMFWDAATLALLRGAYITRYVEGRRAALLDDYARLRAVPMFADTTCLECCGRCRWCPRAPSASRSPAGPSKPSSRWPT